MLWPEWKVLYWSCLLHGSVKNSRKPKKDTYWDEGFSQVPLKAQKEFKSYTSDSRNKFGLSYFEKCLLFKQHQHHENIITIRYDVTIARVTGGGKCYCKARRCEDASDNKSPSPSHSKFFNWFFKVIYAECGMCPPLGQQWPPGL